MRIEASTPSEYLAALPPERAAVIAAVRAMVLRNLRPGFEETVRWGMLSYEVPLSRYPVTYNKLPLAYIGLAAQKQFYALYLMSAVDGGAVFRLIADWYRKAGKKLDMGKCCLRFKRLEDVPLELLGQAVASHDAEEFIAFMEASRAGTPKRAAVSTAAAKRPANPATATAATTPAAKKLAKKVAKKVATNSPTKAAKKAAKKAVKPTARPAPKKSAASTAKPVAKPAVTRAAKRPSTRAAASPTTRRTPRGR
jgi:hypothetical protein